MIRTGKMITRRSECDPFEMIKVPLSPKLAAPRKFTSVLWNLLNSKCRCGKYSEFIDTSDWKRVCCKCLLKNLRPDRMTHQKSAESYITDSSEMERSLSARSNSFGVVPESRVAAETEIVSKIMPFTNFQFSDYPHIIIDTGSSNLLTESTVMNDGKFPYVTKSLQNALYYMQAGWTIQIQRDRS